MMIHGRPIIAVAADGVVVIVPAPRNSYIDRQMRAGLYPLDFAGECEPPASGERAAGVASPAARPAD